MPSFRTSRRTSIKSSVTFTPRRPNMRLLQATELMQIRTNASSEAIGQLHNRHLPTPTSRSDPDSTLSLHHRGLCRHNRRLGYVGSSHLGSSSSSVQLLRKSRNPELPIHMSLDTTGDSDCHSCFAFSSLVQTMQKRLFRWSTTCTD